MHQRDICLCPDCLREAINDEPDEERRRQAMAWIAAVGSPLRGEVRQVAAGVVRRRPRRAA